MVLDMRASILRRRRFRVKNHDLRATLQDLPGLFVHCVHGFGHGAMLAGIALGLDEGGALDPCFVSGIHMRVRATCRKAARYILHALLRLALAWLSAREQECPNCLGQRAAHAGRTTCDRLRDGTWGAELSPNMLDTAMRICDSSGSRQLGSLT